MNRKASKVSTLAPPVAENRRMSMARGLLPGTDGPRRTSNVAPGRTSISTGPSLVGLLVSKRLAKRLTTRFFDRRGGSMWGSSRLSSQAGIPIQKEPSYRMEPHNKFCPAKAKQAIQEVLDERLEKFKYNPKFCANISKVLSDEIRDKVKKLNFDRYKIICEVHIGEKKDQGMVVTSRCTWDDKLDNFASYTFQNRFIFCTATVFGVYSE